MEVNPFSALSSLGESSSDRIGIAEDFDTFLELLTTQLQHQNPLDPLDTNQFTEQLVQFTGVEQAVKTNENLEALTQITAVTAINGAVGFIGKEISANGNTKYYEGGETSWSYRATSESQSATFNIIRSDGVTVYSENRSITEGIGEFTWDGQTDDGGIAPNDIYTLSVQATDEAGFPINVETGRFGLVTGVDMAGGTPVLIVDGEQIMLDHVTSVRDPAGS